MNEQEGLVNAVNDFVDSLSEDQKNALADILLSESEDLDYFLRCAIFAEE
jgi:hypothetical protein